MVLAAETQPGGALLGLSPEKLDPQILKLEIERLVRLSNIELRLGVSIDLNLLTDLQSGFDLIIVDPSELADISPVKDVALDFMKVEAGKNTIKVIHAGSVERTQAVQIFFDCSLCRGRASYRR